MPAWSLSVSARSARSATSRRWARPAQWPTQRG